MADSFTPFLQIRLPATGAYDNTWGATLNADALNLLDTAIAGWTAIDIATATTYALPAMTQGEASTTRYFGLYFTGSPTGPVTVTVPVSVTGKQYLIFNDTGQVMTFTYGASGATAAVPVGALQFIWADGTNVDLPATNALSAQQLGGIPAQYWVQAELDPAQVAADTIVQNSVSIPTAFPYDNQADSPTITINWNNGNSQAFTLTGNRTVAAPTNPIDGAILDVLMIQDGTGSRTLTWNSVFLFVNGLAPTLGTAPGAIDRFVMRYNLSLNKWLVGQFGNLNAGSGTTLPITISTNTVDWSLKAILGTLASAATINILVQKGVIMEASNTQVPAMDLSGLISGCTINLTNLGYIQGRGGDGGDGGSAAYPGSGTTVIGPSPGLAGGKAILGPGSGCTFNITNGNGNIWGGGGGGGAGGVYDGLAGGNGCANTPGGGGGAGGGRGGRGGRGVYIAGTYSPALDGQSGSLGLNGTFGTAGGSGTGTSQGGGQIGTSQSGGNWGTAGTAGTNPATTTVGHFAPFSAGGAAGKAIELSGGAATFLSGSGSPNVQGAVS